MDAATAAKAQQASSGEDTAAKAKAAGLENTAKLSKAGCKMSQGCNQTDNNDGTYTLSGKTKAGIEWSKTFVDPTGSAHKVGAPDANYVAKVKAQLGHNLNGDQIGQDTNGDGAYKGKSLKIMGGGRSLMLQDRITDDLVGKGYSHEEATNIARAKAKANFLNKMKNDPEYAQSAKAAGYQPQPAAAKVTQQAQDQGAVQQPATAGVSA